MVKAVEIMGDIDPKEAQMFIGYHGHLLTFPIANATILNGAPNLHPFAPNDSLTLW
jgi:hypothetical protein